MTSFVTNLNINTTLDPGQTDGSPSKAVLLCGQRLTNGELILSSNGAAQPNLYVPFALPAFQTGIAALQYLSNFGIKYTMGINFTFPLPAPDHVSIVSGVTQLTWDNVPANFGTLTGFNLSGVLSQGGVNGGVRSASIINSIATLFVSGQPAFITSANSGQAMTLAGLNNEPYPDPNASDPIAIMAWSFYETYKSANTSAEGSPFAYISILSDLDSSIDPNPAPIALPIPSSVVVNPDSTVSLIFNYTNISMLTNFGYLPTTVFGDTQVKQDTASGLYQGFEINPSQTGGSAVITLSDVSGTFNDTLAVSVVLDNTTNVMSFLDGVQLHGGVLQFPVSTISDIEIKHASFFNGLKALNASNQLLNNHYFTYAWAGNVTSLPINAGSLPSPNYQGYCLASYPYVYKFGAIPIDNTAGTVGSGFFASAAAYMLANGDPPYPALALSSINHIPTPPAIIALSTSYSAQPGGSGDVAIQQGWMPFVPIKGQATGVQFLQSNTSMITLPGTTVPDVEFRFTHIWDCIRWARFEITELYETIIVLPNNIGRANISPDFLTQFRAGIVSILDIGENLGIFENVGLYQNLVKVVRDPSNPNGVAVTMPSQIIPQINSATVDIVIFGANYDFSTNTVNAVNQ